MGGIQSAGDAATKRQLTLKASMFVYIEKPWVSSVPRLEHRRLTFLVNLMDVGSLELYDLASHTENFHLSLRAV